MSRKFLKENHYLEFDVINNYRKKIKFNSSRPSELKH